MGIVVEMTNSILTIKLETGVVINMPQTHDIKTGHRVQVIYDFTKREVIKVIPYVENAREREVNVREPEKPDTPDVDDDSDILVLDSGALRPSWDGWWEAWDSDSGVLGLSGL